MGQREISACGVGFVASRTGQAEHAILEEGLHALSRVEHRGGVLGDGITGDGAGVMTGIPFELFGLRPGSVVVASLFLLTPRERRALALQTFEETFAFLGLKVRGYREVPVDESVLGPDARASLPELLHAFLERPAFCRTDASLGQLLYRARQTLRTKLAEVGVVKELFFASLSTKTIVYKALTTASALGRFYEDLKNPAFRTRFCLFHRRFSTNTVTTWDKAQPFRLIAHNGEINTIRANRSWSFAREQALGLPEDELLTHHGISDSGHVNEMTEALKYRSSIPELEDILAILIPPAGETNDWYRFWSRAQEPWDGPAFIAYCDGETIGGRLDRNGFRPCRWALTDERFYLASEAGVFGLDEREVLARGTLRAGSGVKLDLSSGVVHFRDPSRSRENEGATLDPRLHPLEKGPREAPRYLAKKRLFGLTREELERLIVPLIEEGKEPIGSMGDTSRLAVFSTERRSFFDFFYQTFAQVTNPPLDYLRERVVCDLSTYLGKRPNVFAPKELIPPKPALLARTPVLRLGELSWLRALRPGVEGQPRLRGAELDLSFPRERGAEGMEESLERMGEEACALVRKGASILVLTDRDASPARPPVPSLLALSAVVRALSESGLRLEASLVVETGEARTAHAVAALLAFGATAVCPALVLELAREGASSVEEADAREERAARALEGGLLKIMSKMGISVVRSYEGSRLFSALGLGADLLERYFPGLEPPTPIGGLSLRHVAEDVLRHTALTDDDDAKESASARGDESPPDQASDEVLPSSHLLKEHNKGLVGEKHAMTSARSRLVHEVVNASDADTATARYQALLSDLEESEPIHPRHLLELVPATEPLALEAVEPTSEITKRFGAGAMSFGAINAEAQRDIILAMRDLGGRSNSGEGGENPYYFLDGTTASTKQIASARFGITGEYLVVGDEIEIKIAQGAKPGEGGQLMAVKVDEAIARARFARPGADLISPPPMHDIYSIEDLKELIFELKQLAPDKRVAVKLVSGVDIGTIAAGVVKAGADVIQISGGDGGTGAATLTSMRHAGLPWELGLVAVHRELCERGLRDAVRLRIDGGIATGRDVVVAAALGADEVGFGKLLLVAEGCIMARVCEKNTCPRGIATHDPRFRKKYRGKKEHIVTLLRLVAEDARQQLALVGYPSLSALRGRARVLRPAKRHARLFAERAIDLSALLAEASPEPTAAEHDLKSARGSSPFTEGVTALNNALVERARPALEEGRPVVLDARVRSTDRAVLATLNGVLARRQHEARLTRLARGEPAGPEVFLGLPPGSIEVRLRGSAGQGFAVFLQQGLDVTLVGEANDSVAKGMSGGRLVVRPPEDARFVPEDCAILGNAALYGATGGTLLVSGRAGDRFAVRNSGAIAIVDGVGLHACAYMTGGAVVILGEASHNLGAGMTGGVLYTRAENERFLNRDYLCPAPLTEADLTFLHTLLAEHAEATGSRSSRVLTEDPARIAISLCKYEPLGTPSVHPLPVTQGENAQHTHPSHPRSIVVEERLGERL